MNERKMRSLVRDWLNSCESKGRVSRNTVAAGIVVLHKLREQCPLSKDDAITARGELRGARSGLASVLKQYGITGYLKEVTTRQASPDALRLLTTLDWGKALSHLSKSRRARVLSAGIKVLVQAARQWFERQHIRVKCDRQHSPSRWVGLILEQAKGKSGGVVEQHLVGAKLAQRHPDVTIPNYPSHAGDVQTRRPGDFCLGSTAYHVTASPARGVIRKCKENLESGLHPVLVVPRGEAAKAAHLAEDEGVRERITIMPLEEFVSANIIEMSVGDQKRFTDQLSAIIETYNRRLDEVETDPSLKIELK